MYKRNDLIEFQLIWVIMASSVDWSKLLEARYPSYRVEVEAFLDSLEVSNSNDIIIGKVFEAIRYHNDVDDNLKLLYGEAVYGSDEQVKLHIKSRMSNFRRALV